MSLDKNDMMLIVVLAIPVMLCLGIVVFAYVSGTDDGTPEWAKDVAGDLEEKGGRIDVFRTWGDSNYGATYTATTIAADSDVKVVADHTGFTIISTNGITHISYDRVSAIYVNTGY